MWTDILMDLGQKVRKLPELIRDEENGKVSELVTELKETARLNELLEDYEQMKKSLIERLEVERDQREKQKLRDLEEAARPKKLIKGKPQKKEGRKAKKMDLAVLWHSWRCGNSSPVGCWGPPRPGPAQQGRQICRSKRVWAIRFFSGKNIIATLSAKFSPFTILFGRILYLNNIGVGFQSNHCGKTQTKTQRIRPTKNRDEHAGGRHSAEEEEKAEDGREDDRRKGGCAGAAGAVQVRGGPGVQH